MALDIQTAADAQGRCRIVLRGMLDAGTSPRLDQELERVLRDGAPRALVFDLAGLEYVSSAGLRVLFKARRAMQQHGAPLLMVGPQPQVRKVFEIVRATPLDEIFASTEELDRYLDTIQRRMLDAGDEDD
ncbi:anti-sigma factor antagonist [Mizugakiibacter sediminis]|uniref:Anti-sigma factor antagonist n=1 Tax=Mizugakiibacter sediminis TaxID=1475481 RepID=A0A0K8QJJ4_9GAMM|nr:STAS domain-containing protein [Mizugakiibacter sediminis]GAP64871.1 anti-sigma factor antagonist [Mizugakiibacter sediminis]